MKQLSLFKKTESCLVKSCAFTGHRRLQGDCSFEEVEETLRSLIERGVDTFYNGMAMGFDLLCAECVLFLKKEFPHIKLLACLPCLQQERGYGKTDRDRYDDILTKADECILLSEQYYDGCMLHRNRYMADRADILIAYHRKKTGGTAYTVNYFKKNYPNREIIFL